MSRYCLFDFSLLLKKRFRVKIEYSFYTHDTHYYHILYAWYRVFPYWRNVRRFLDNGFSSGSGYVEDFANAEELSSTFKTIEDIRSYLSIEKDKETDYNKRYREYQLSIKPDFYNKDIINN